ncbi:c-type cytochrome [Roseibacillus persicicus]|uniref:c-type cytochrome n=1 Tax=Roseibacillus persicicus TaxID=454148 RepID=UPI001673FDC2|nr:c-type cytochrome [Roseibacillus persicicus]
MKPSLSYRYPLLTAACLSLGSAALAQPIIGGLDREMDAILAGRVLLTELNCVACHNSSLQAKGAPALRETSTRIQQSYLEEFLTDPHQAKPGTTMPNLLGSLEKEEQVEAAKSLSDYILSLQTEGTPTLPAPKPSAESTARGKELYHQVGCVACHNPEGSSLENSIPLHRLGEKFIHSALVAFLENPHKARPSARMPDFQLELSEATDLASYLLRDAKVRESVQADLSRVAAGKEWFEKLHCAQCHDPEQAPLPLAKALTELDGNRDCSATDYQLTETQTSWIQAALQSMDDEWDPQREIDFQMTQLNCYACHQRDGKGGPGDGRDSYFTTTNLNLGEQARIPPSLSHIGAKLIPYTLKETLTNGSKQRPYMNTRMPAYGSAPTKDLLELFLAHDKLPVAEFTRNEVNKDARLAGQTLVGDQHFSCVACHTFNGHAMTTLNAIDMTVMANRLTENWFHLFLRNPQQFHGTTIMPNFWPDGKSIRPEMLDGDRGKQIDAIWQYLEPGQQARMPSGVRPEPIFLDADQGEAVMLRRQYTGIGKRGIGVGYPSELNIAFDAAQCRLGSLWQGPFGEMSAVWRGQGSGFVKERSKTVYRFPVGPALALLDDMEAAWPVVEEAVKAPGFQFKGYTLDAVQRPTFRYLFDGMEIKDFFEDQSDGSTFVRSLTFDKKGSEKLFFRVAAGEKVTAGADEKTYLLDGQLQMKLSLPGQIRTVDSQQELIVPLAGAESFTITYEFLTK